MESKFLLPERDVNTCPNELNNCNGNQGREKAEISKRLQREICSELKKELKLGKKKSLKPVENCNCLKTQKINSKRTYLANIARVFNLKIGMILVEPCSKKIKIQYINSAGSNKIFLLELPLYSNSLLKTKHTLKKLISKKKIELSRDDPLLLLNLQEKLLNISEIIDTPENHYYIPCTLAFSGNTSELIDSPDSHFKLAIQRIKEANLTNTLLNVISIATKKLGKNNQKFQPKHRLSCRKEESISWCPNGWHKKPLTISAFLRIQIDLSKEKLKTDLDISTTSKFFKEDGSRVISGVQFPSIYNDNFYQSVKLSNQSSKNSYKSGQFSNSSFGSSKKRGKKSIKMNQNKKRLTSISTMIISPIEKNLSFFKEKKPFFPLKTNKLPFQNDRIKINKNYDDKGKINQTSSLKKFPHSNFKNVHKTTLNQAKSESNYLNSNNRKEKKDYSQKCSQDWIEEEFYRGYEKNILQTPKKKKPYNLDKRSNKYTTEFETFGKKLIKFSQTMSTGDYNNHKPSNSFNSKRFGHYENKNLSNIKSKMIFYSKFNKDTNNLFDRSMPYELFDKLKSKESKNQKLNRNQELFAVEEADSPISNEDQKKDQSLLTDSMEGELKTFAEKKD